MIKGIGIDHLRVDRIKAALEKSSFCQKYYTHAELALGKWQKLANNFAAKEAVAKAFGLGFRQFYLSEVEILRDNLGKPYVRLHGNARKTARRMRIKSIHVSISDTEEYITAVAIIEK